MSDRIRIGSLSFLIVVYTGCMARGPVFLESKATEAKPGYALVYIFREYAEPTLHGANILISGKKVVTLKQCGFTWIYAKPGNRKIVADWGAFVQDLSYISLNIQDGKVYYVELTGFSKSEGITTSPGFQTFHFSQGASLSMVNGEAAEVRLAKCCKFQKPINTFY